MSKSYNIEVIAKSSPKIDVNSSEDLFNLSQLTTQVLAIDYLNKSFKLITLTNSCQMLVNLLGCESSENWICHQNNSHLKTMQFKQLKQMSFHVHLLRQTPIKTLIKKSGIVSMALEINIKRGEINKATICTSISVALKSSCRTD